MNLYQIILFFLVFIFCIVILSEHLKNIILNQNTIGEKIFEKVERILFRRKIYKQDMIMREYIFSFLKINIFFILIACFILLLNGVTPILAFNIAISFITNTNLQHYSGEMMCSNLVRITLTVLMFVSAAGGISLSFAVIRGIFGKGIGNFYTDFIKIIVRVLLPISLLSAIILVICGTPQTFSTSFELTTLEGEKQTIPLGIVATWESIKHLGTNGGGIFGANSAHPFENVSIYTNYIEMLLMMIIPSSLILTFGKVGKNNKQGWMLFSAIFVVFISSVIAIYFFEKNFTLFKEVGIVGGNMEGKEVRFGIFNSSLFTAITTAFSTGSTNVLIDKLTPLGIVVVLLNMIFNCIFGGCGVGFINLISYIIISVFLCGLMIGKTPEFFGKKLDKEIKIITFIILLQPLIVLIPTVITILNHSFIVDNNCNNLTKIFYEFVSSANNNGSNFSTLNIDNLLNNLTSIVMILGRYVGIILTLFVVDSFSKKNNVSTDSSLRTDSILFSVVLIFVIFVIGALTFLPVITLGPIAEHLILLGGI